MDHSGPKYVEPPSVVNKLNHKTLCIWLVYTYISATQLQVHLQATPVQQLPKKFNISEQLVCQVADNVPNDINPNVDAVRNLIPLIAKSMTITTCSKVTVVNARNINTSKTRFVCSQNVA